MILYIDACVRENSRTKRLADALMEKLSGEVKYVKLEDISFETTSEEYLTKRENLIEQCAFDDKMFDLARQFAKADTIVIAAPYWDLSFPAKLKQYIEAINVLGITFLYTPEGMPKGMCKADKLYYVTTAGGPVVPDEYGYGYIKALAESYYGIKDVSLIKASGLDVLGAAVDAIMNEAIASISV